MKKTTKEIIDRPVNVKENSSVEDFIFKAIENNLPVETMERLFALREKVKAEQAKEAFTEAMATFQAECPIIVKDKVVLNKDGKTIRYRYAPLDSIVSQVKESLATNGLSYSFDEKKDDKTISAICKITHKLGHSEVSSFQIPIGTEDYMSDPQKHGARITFAKRYAFSNALGILTGEEDTDATEDKKGVTENTLREIESITTLDALKTYYLANKGKGKEFDKAVTEHKKFLENVKKEENENI